MKTPWRTIRSETNASRSDPWSGRAGVTVVEVALVLPIFLIMLMGIIDLCRYSCELGIISHCAREGIRQGTTGKLKSGQTNRTNSILAYALEADYTNLTQKEIWGSEAVVEHCTDEENNVWGPGAGAHGEKVRITITRNFVFITPLVGWIMGGGLESGGGGDDAKSKFNMKTTYMQRNTGKPGDYDINPP